MNVKTLHIAHSDALTVALEKWNPEDSSITWREMLCEGKTLSNMGSDAFWETRFHFLHKTYNTRKSEFSKSILAEYEKLLRCSAPREIVLWFRADLFCQINLLALLSWLNHHRKNTPIALASHEKGKLTGDTLAEFSEEQFVQACQNRLHLTPDDVEYGDYVWQLYCSDNPLRLETFSKFNSSQFQDLPHAIKTHLLRFPSLKNGLNQLENEILAMAAAGNLSSKKELVAQLHQTQTAYGYTDAQYHEHINRLRPLFHSFKPLRLSSIGKQVKEGAKNYYSGMRDDEAYLGGSKKYDFLYDGDSDKLLKL